MNITYLNFISKHLNRQSLQKFNIIKFIVLIGLSLVLPIFVKAVPPGYQLQYLGNGSPTAINNNGLVVGARRSGTNYLPLVSLNGAAWTDLSIPTGAVSVYPTAVNDNGIIVGVSFNVGSSPQAVRWTRDNNGVYQVEFLPRLAGQNTSFATGINNLGQIVGARSSLGYVPTGSGWLYSETSGIVDLTTYNFWSSPTDINNNGVIIGGIERLNLATGQVDVVGNGGPSNYYPISGIAVNDNGFIAGTAPLRSTSLNIVSLYRYEGVSGWRYLTGTSRYTIASSINSFGDVGYGELGAGLYVNNLGIFPVGELLEPIYREQGWAISGTGVFINNQRAIATNGQNRLTGETGGVLLTTNGDLPTPSAPINLQGTPIPATRMHPFNSIDLVWENTSVLTQRYELQRRDVTSNEWITLSLIPPGTSPRHEDSTVGVGVNYEYRVRAVGFAGSGVWSASIFITSPSTPLDTTPPVANLLNPADGSTVSGIVPVSATATDNVAVEYLEISFWNQYSGQEIIVGSVYNSGSLAVNWDTRNLTPATYRLRAYTYDTMGNWTTKDISVNVVRGTIGNTVRVSNITLSSFFTVTGRVTVVDGNGEIVRGALVNVEWRLPNGRMETALSVTNSAGNAFFVSQNRRGTYTLTVTEVVKDGYTFNLAGSVLTKSITR